MYIRGSIVRGGGLLCGTIAKMMQNRDYHPKGQERLHIQEVSDIAT